MFNEIYTLPIDVKERQRLIQRWESEVGKSDLKKIYDLINQGAGEHLLESVFQRKEITSIENEYDLRGVTLRGLEVNFKTADNFKGIDFAHSNISACTFNNATFLSSTFHYATIQNCIFNNCYFVLCKGTASYFINSEFTNCNFIDHNQFNNDVFTHTKFTNCFFQYRVFYNCNFIDTEVSSLNFEENTTRENRKKIDELYISKIYRSLKEAYKEGDERELALKYYFLEKNAYRHYNELNLSRIIKMYFLEKLIGYGYKPVRTLALVLLIFISFSFLHFIFGGFKMETLIFSAGAFFTFGAMSDTLLSSAMIVQIIYILESFFGVGSIALFVTILANYFFGDIP